MTSQNMDKLPIETAPKDGTWIVVWGENGIISAADALEAITADNFAFASINEAFTPGEQVTAALDALGLVVVPDPPL